jgi:hypothetical protein
MTPHSLVAMRIRTIITFFFLTAMLSGCVTAPSRDTDLAVNLGLEYVRDNLRLQDLLASAGIDCGMRAMSPGAEQIVVHRADFERARVLAVDIVVRELLTVRLWKSPGSSELEIWEKGQKVRDEPYMLYLWTPETVDSFMKDKIGNTQNNDIVPCANAIATTPHRSQFRISRQTAGTWLPTQGAELASLDIGTRK